MWCLAASQVKSQKPFFGLPAWRQEGEDNDRSDQSVLKQNFINIPYISLIVTGHSVDLFVHRVVALVLSCTM